MKPSELDKLMQGKTIAHIGEVVSFMQQLHIVYSDYGTCAPPLEAVEEALPQNFSIWPSQIDHSQEGQAEGFRQLRDGETAETPCILNQAPSTGCCQAIRVYNNVRQAS